MPFYCLYEQRALPETWLCGHSGASELRQRVSFLDVHALPALPSVLGKEPVEVLPFFSKRATRVSDS